MSDPQFSNSRQKTVLKNPRSWNNSPTPNPFKQPLSWIFDIHRKMDLEKLVWTPSISAQLPETFELLWAKRFENHVFSASIPKGAKSKIPRFWILCRLWRMPIAEKRGRESTRVVWSLLLSPELQQRFLPKCAHLLVGFGQQQFAKLIACRGAFRARGRFHFDSASFGNKLKILWYKIIYRWWLVSLWNLFLSCSRHNSESFIHARLDKICSLNSSFVTIVAFVLRFSENHEFLLFFFYLLALRKEGAPADFAITQ